MTDTPGSPAAVDGPSHDRLDSWKEIAAYMRRDVKTVQRWEKREGMPVHRHLHDKMGSVYAFRSDLDAWAERRRLTQPADAVLPTESSGALEPQQPQTIAVTTRARWVWPLAIAAVLLSAMGMLWSRRGGDATASPLADARFQQLTDFDGVEQAAAISRDGKLVAFLSDRDGQMDVWITQLGTGEFHNLTRGAARDIVNPSVRALDFSPDGTLVTFWARRLAATQQSEISVWGVPVLGGPPRPYLDGIAEFDWTNDAGRLVYHTPGAGDPMFVREGREGAAAVQIFSAPAGLHSHFPLWSPDAAHIYFVQGTPPDRLDIWRIKPDGTRPERLTQHDAVVTYPVFVDARTLFYLASDRDGSGPWIHSLDVVRQVSRRVSFGLERYTSLAASRDGRRLVATLASPKGTLWRVPIRGDKAETSAARPISLTTGNGSSPRIANGFLLYVSSKGPSDSIWKLQGDRAAEVWNAPESRIVGAPAISTNGRQVAFTVRRTDGRTQLLVVNVDGTDPRVVPLSLDLQGAPAWAPNGESVIVAAVEEGTPRLYRVFLDGRTPERFVAQHSIDPTWSPAGDMVVFSGADIGTTFPVRAVAADGAAYPTPEVTLSRGARRLAFLPGQRTLVVLRGEIQHKNLWAIDLESGAERQLTDFAAGFDVHDFDISPDGSELVVEQVQEQSDIVLLEIPPR